LPVEMNMVNISTNVPLTRLSSAAVNDQPLSNRLSICKPIKGLIPRVVGTLLLSSGAMASPRSTLTNASTKPAPLMSEQHLYLQANAQHQNPIPLELRIQGNNISTMQTMLANELIHNCAIEHALPSAHQNFSEEVASVTLTTKPPLSVDLLTIGTDAKLELYGLRPSGKQRPYKWQQHDIGNSMLTCMQETLDKVLTVDNSAAKQRLVLPSMLALASIFGLLLR